MDPESFEALRKRLGDEHLGKRLLVQVNYVARYLGRGRTRFHFEALTLPLLVFRTALRVTAIYERGVQNAFRWETTRNRFTLRQLPRGAALRVLHLSDLHLDAHPELVPRLEKYLEGLEFDLCLITGDYRYRTHGPYDEAVRLFARIAPLLQCPLGVYGVLGNHDFIEMVPGLEKAGMQLLLNESVRIDCRGGDLWIVGLDDVHFYGAENFAKAFSNVPRDAAKILLVHSPEAYRSAAKWNTNLYLAGHTHAGQVCLPGKRAPFVNASCPRPFAAGRWRYKEMIGYTSAGTGSSGVFVRYNCPPEIAIHELVGGY